MEKKSNIEGRRTKCALIDQFLYGTSNGVIVASLREKRRSSLSPYPSDKTWLDSNETDEHFVFDVACAWHTRRSVRNDVGLSWFEHRLADAKWCRPVFLPTF